MDHPTDLTTVLDTTAMEDCLNIHGIAKIDTLLALRDDSAVTDLLLTRLPSLSHVASAAVTFSDEVAPLVA